MPNPQESGVDIQQLAATRVFAGPDQSLLVGQLWQRQSVILVFLRHFACIACRAHAAQVWRDREKYEGKGARIVFIGNGQPSWIEVFKLELGLQHALVLTDPCLQSFQAAGLNRGLKYLLHPRSAIGMAKLSAAGYSQGPMDSSSGSHRQMGGILAISTSANVVYRFVSRSVGDLPNEPYRDIIWRDEQAA